MEFESLEDLRGVIDFQEVLDYYTSGCKITRTIAFDRFNKKNISTIRYDKDHGVYLLIRFVNKWDVLFYGHKAIYEIAYVGITNNFYNRMNQHRNDKEFDVCVLVLLDKPYAWSFERALISSIKPPLNQVHSKPSELNSTEK